jgi:hypothetical protein
VRIFKRLFPIFLVPVLLAGVALAQSTGVARTSQCPGAGISKSRLIQCYNHAPDPLPLDFGTVVRDTADDQSVGPGQRQLPREVAPWTSFFSWSWFNLLIPR